MANRDMWGNPVDNKEKQEPSVDMGTPDGEYTSTLLIVKLPRGREIAVCLENVGFVTLFGTDEMSTAIFSRRGREVMTVQGRELYDAVTEALKEYHK